jgi:hypothetical protein
MPGHCGAFAVFPYLYNAVQELSFRFVDAGGRRRGCHNMSPLWHVPPMSTFKTSPRRVVMRKTINSASRLTKQVTDRHSFSQITIPDSEHRAHAATPVIAAARGTTYRSDRSLSL